VPGTRRDHPPTDFLARAHAPGPGPRCRGAAVPRCRGAAQEVNSVQVRLAARS